MEGMMVGTVAYMPPEQALGRQPDARSDLYSLGCVAYEMVTGRAPFLGDDPVAIISQHINTAPVAPSWHNPEVPRALESLIMRLLAKDPNERPASAAAIPEALAAIVSSASTTAPAAQESDVNPLDRLATGIFVGRDKEMDELRAGLEDALSGRGRLMMLVGEPGIGKTRTSEEFATYARLRNVQVLWGRCYEGEGAPAYWPWVQIIRSYVHDKEPKELMSEMGPGRGGHRAGGLRGERAAARAAGAADAGAGAGTLPAVRQHHDVPEERLAGRAADGRARRPALGGQAVAAAAAVPGEGAARQPPDGARHLPRRRAAPPAPAGADAGRAEPREPEPARAPPRAHRERRAPLHRGDGGHVAAGRAGGGGVQGDGGQPVLRQRDRAAAGRRRAAGEGRGRQGVERDDPAERAGGRRAAARPPVGGMQPGADDRLRDRARVRRCSCWRRWRR